MGSFFKKSEPVVRKRENIPFIPTQDDLYEKEEVTRFDAYSCASTVETEIESAGDIRLKKIDQERQMRAIEISDVKEKIASKEKAVSEKKLLKKKEKEKADEHKKLSQSQPARTQSKDQEKKRKGEPRKVSDVDNALQQGDQQISGPFKFNTPTLPSTPTTINPSGTDTTVKSNMGAQLLPPVPKRSYLDSKQPSAVQQQLLHSQAIKQERDKQKKEQLRKEQENILRQQNEAKLLQANQEKERMKVRERRLKALANKVFRKTSLVAKAKVMISWYGAVFHILLLSVIFISFSFQTLFLVFRQLALEAQEAMDDSLLLSFIFRRWQAAKQKKQMQRKSLANALLSVDISRHSPDHDRVKVDRRINNLEFSYQQEPLLMSLATAIHMIDPMDAHLLDFPTLIGTALQRTQDCHVKKISPSLTWNQGLFMKMRLLSLSSLYTGGFWDEEDSVVVNLMRSMLSNDNHGGEQGMIGLWENDHVDCRYDFASSQMRPNAVSRPLERSVSMCVVEGYGHDALSEHYHKQSDDSDVVLLLVSINDAMKKFRQDYEKTTNDEELFCVFLQHHVASLIQGTLGAEDYATERPIVAVYVHEVFKKDIKTVQSQFYPVLENDDQYGDVTDIVTNAILCIAGSFNVQNSFMFDVSSPLELSTFPCLVSHHIAAKAPFNSQIERCRHSLLQQITSVLSILVVATSTVTSPLPLVQRFNIADHVSELLHEHIWAPDLSVRDDGCHDDALEAIKQRSCRCRLLQEIDRVVSKIRQSMFYHRPFPSSSFAFTTTDGELVVFGALYDDQSGSVYGANCVHAEWWKNEADVQRNESLMEQLSSLRDRLKRSEEYSSGTSWRRLLSHDVNQMIKEQFHNFSTLEKLIYVYHDVDLEELNDVGASFGTDVVSQSVTSVSHVYSPTPLKNQKQICHVANEIERASFTLSKSNKRARDEGNDHYTLQDDAGNDIGNVGSVTDVVNGKENLLTSSNHKNFGVANKDRTDVGNNDDCDSVGSHVMKKERPSVFTEEKDAYLKLERLLDRALHSEVAHSGDSIVTAHDSNVSGGTEQQCANINYEATKDVDIAERCRLEREKFEEIMRSIR